MMLLSMNIIPYTLMININATNINKLVTFNYNTYFTEKLEHTRNTTNNITRQNHNNYDHDVI